MINDDDLPDDLATRVLSTSTHLAAAVAFADEVRAVLHQRDEASDTELVERMGGAVTVDDAPGGGARFTVWLPPAGSGAGEAIAERGRDDATAR